MDVYTPQDDFNPDFWKYAFFTLCGYEVLRLFLKRSRS